MKFNYKFHLFTSRMHCYILGLKRFTEDVNKYKRKAKIFKISIAVMCTLMKGGHFFNSHCRSR